MPYITTNDKTRLFYEDWGSGKPAVFVSSWGLGNQMWEYQTVPLSGQGIRCIGFDRRGHGRSDDPGRGYTFDTFASDLASLIEQLDLRELVMVGHSMGSGEIARYLSLYGTSRIDRVVLIGPTTPYLLHGPDNPNGIPKIVFDQMVAGLSHDRAKFLSEGIIKFFGIGAEWPWPSRISPENISWALRLALKSSPKAVIECTRAFSETDFRKDMRAFTLPTLLIHGENDQIAPFGLCGQGTANLLPNCQLIRYEGSGHGLFLVDKERLNADLTRFILSSSVE